MIRSSSHEQQQPMAILLNIGIGITQAVQGKMAATVPPVFRVSTRCRARMPARLPQSIPDPIQMQRCREHNAPHNCLHVTDGTLITHAVLVKVRKGWRQLCLVHQQRRRMSRERKACTVAAICLCPPMHAPIPTLTQQRLQAKEVHTQLDLRGANILRICGVSVTNAKT